MPLSVVHTTGVVNHGHGPAAQAEPEVDVSTLDPDGQKVSGPLIRAAGPHQKPVRVPGPKLQLYSVGGAAQSVEIGTSAGGGGGSGGQRGAAGGGSGRSQGTASCQ